MDARGEERRFDFRAILGDPALVTTIPRELLSAAFMHATSVMSALAAVSGSCSGLTTKHAEESEEIEDRTKRVTLRITWDCPDDTPAHVLTWLAHNLSEYVANEFGHNYDSDFVNPPFEGPALVGDVRVDIYVGASPELIASTASTGCAGLRRGDGNQ